MASTTSSSTKRIAPAAYDALADALALIFWNKGPFQRFLRLQLHDHPELLAGLNFDDPKRQVASELIMRLAAREERYQAVTLKLMLDVAAIDDFPNLRQQQDAADLVVKAEDAVANLRRWTTQYGEMAEAQQRLRAEEEAKAARSAERDAMARALDALKARYLSMHADSDHQNRGRIFEGLLNELFALFDLSPRKSFVLADEQIDGAFTFSTDDYLLEAKWEQSVASREEVDVLAQKVQRKGKNTLGLFVAIAGFSEPAIRAHSNCGSGLVFMDGADLYSVLDGQVSLVDVLEAKRRHLSETGQPLLLVREMLS